MAPSRNMAFASMSFGFGVWMSALITLYAAQAIGCELAWHRKSIGPVSLLRFLLVVLWLAHIAAVVWTYFQCRRALVHSRTEEALDRFLWRASTVLSLGASMATLWIGSALWLTSICPI